LALIAGTGAADPEAHGLKGLTDHGGVERARVERQRRGRPSRPDGEQGQIVSVALRIEPGMGSCVRNLDQDAAARQRRAEENPVAVVGADHAVGRSQHGMGSDQAAGAAQLAVCGCNGNHRRIAQVGSAVGDVDVRAPESLGGCARGQEQKRRQPKSVARTSAPSPPLIRANARASS